MASNWEALRNNPSEWYDNRRRKTNPRAPDFVRRDDRSVAIWIDSRDNPDWCDQVLNELDERQSDRQSDPGQGRGGERRSSRGDSSALWEALSNNPDEWYDNRRRKTNPRAPDFVRRDDRTVAIWIDSGDTPSWHTDVLAQLDARFYERRQERQDRPPREVGDERAAQDLAKWESLRDHPEEWHDQRNRKSSPRAPDFKRRDDKFTALWLDSATTPEWVGEVLDMLDARQRDRAASYDQQRHADRQQQTDQNQQVEYDSPEREAKRVAVATNWEALRANPEEWVDARFTKTNPRAPDFKHVTVREQAVWLSSYDRPEWAEEWLALVDAGQVQLAVAQARQPRAAPSGVDLDARKADELAKWESLRDHPDEWFDNRASKQNPRAPDFKRRDDRNVALWVSSYGAPEWLGDLLQQLDARQAQRQQYGQQYDQQYAGAAGMGYPGM